ncbi:MAG: hypothetical protein HY674_20535 [Chloroflexi bacterium]|nr:hypothetical protein [Chloroflexota bacterium]
MNDPETAKSKGRGCFFYGCLTGAILFILGAIALYFGARYAVKTVLNAYTETSPASLPKTGLSTNELARLQAQLEQFQAAVESQKETEPLSLSGAEINALIANEPQLRRYQDQFSITIDRDQIKAQVSIPVDQLGFTSIKGRYLNGSAGLKASLEKGALVVRLQSLEIKGQTIPPPVLDRLSQENLAAQAARDPDAVAFLQKLDAIEVADGKITLKPKVQPAR